MNPILISKISCNKASKASRPLTMGLAAVATIAFAFATSSCATTKGFGRDVQKVGNKIETKANQTGGAN
jgi:predicted small secreted protein